MKLKDEKGESIHLLFRLFTFGAYYREFSSYSISQVRKRPIFAKSTDEIPILHW